MKLKMVVFLTVVITIGFFSSVASAAGIEFLHGQVPKAIARFHLQPIGRLPTTNRLQLAIGLPLRNREELTNLLEQLYDPTSPNYRHFLTPKQFAEMFAPSEQDYQAVIAFAKTNGLTIAGRHSSRIVLDVSGDVAHIQKAFHATMHLYQHPTEKRAFFAPNMAPSVPANVPIASVGGLNNYVVPHPMNLKMAPLNMTNATPADGSGLGGSYLGNDFRHAYVPEVSLDGSGQMVGLLQFNSGFYQSDITAYETAAGLPTGIPVVPVLLDGYDGGPGNANDEVSLDIEMVIAMAPGISGVYVFEGSLTDDILDAMASSNQIKQLSASWTYPIDATSETLFQQFAAQGQSFFNASGDNDAYLDGQESTPTGDPYITVVGGTALTMNGTGGSYASETVWNNRDPNPNGGDWGSSGGISANSIPSWQQGIDMSANGGSTTYRNLPDVALTADNIQVYYGNGLSNTFRGTSCATPLWAGFMALVNEQAVINSQPNVGFINPAIYAIGKGPDYTSCFHDITGGDNTWSGSPTKFYAVSGYDLCTGWGTPNGVSLINALAGGGLSAPILTAEPAVTPGTQNTIYWNSSTQGSIVPAGISQPVATVGGSANSSSQPVRTLGSSLSRVSHTTSSIGPNEFGTNNMRSDDSFLLRTALSSRKNTSAVESKISGGPVSVTSTRTDCSNSYATLPTDQPINTLATSNSENKALGPLGPVPNVLQNIFTETFENAFPGGNWTLLGSPTWKDTSYDYHNGYWSGWCAASSIYPSNGYTNNMNAWMIYGPFSLADASSANVTFWYKNYSELNYDYFKWYASTNGTDFFGQQISGDESSWRSQTFDLSNVYTLGNLCGKNQVWIAFVFTSDSSASGPTYTGAFVDDIIIQKDVITQPDLTPYEPGVWNDKIPIGITQLAGDTTHSYSGPYYDDQTLYFNWASYNQGNATASGYTVHVEVTGTGGGTWDWSSLSTDSTYWTYLTTDQAVGPLAAGSHTFKVWVDYNGNVNESNENNNYYERTINVTTRPKADLTPFQFANWNDKIPIGDTQLAGLSTHNYSGPYYSDQTLYFNWAAYNQGNATASGYTVHVEVTGTGGGTWDWPSLSTSPANSTYLLTDQGVGPLATGSHTFKIWVDYNGNVNESNENNNYYERTINVTTRPKADLTPFHTNLQSKGY